LGSIPFVIFLTWQARVFGLTRRLALLIAICLCGDVMLFNWALRSGWIIEWFLSIAFIFILGMLLPKVQKIKLKDHPSDSKIDIYTESGNIEEIMSEALANSTSIDELIEQGFVEKGSVNFERAAYFFTRALSLDPTPDLAFNLIIDCYWLWNNLIQKFYGQVNA